MGWCWLLRKGLAQRFAGEQEPWVRLLPIASGGLLFVLGALLTVAALQKAGILHFGV